MFFLVFVLFLDCFFNMHLCAKLQPYSSNLFSHQRCGRRKNRKKQEKTFLKHSFSQNLGF